MLDAVSVGVLTRALDLRVKHLAALAALCDIATTFQNRSLKNRLLTLAKHLCSVPFATKPQIVPLPLCPMALGRQNHRYPDTILKKDALGVYGPGLVSSSTLHVTISHLSVCKCGHTISTSAFAALLPSLGHPHAPLLLKLPV